MAATVGFIGYYLNGGGVAFWSCSPSPSSPPSTGFRRCSSPCSQLAVTASATESGSQSFPLQRRSPQWVAVVAYYKIEVASLPFSVIRDVAMPIGMSYYAFRSFTISSINIGAFCRRTIFTITCVICFLCRPCWSARFTGLRPFTRTGIPCSGAPMICPRVSNGLSSAISKLSSLAHFMFSKWLVLAIAEIDSSYQATHLYLEAARGSFNLYSNSPVIPISPSGSPCCSAIG